MRSGAVLKDGLPARSQQLWDSPWGKIGLGICYDDSYSRVTDELIRQGAQALIFPTMDITDWGEAQHLLHGRVAPCGPRSTPSRFSGCAVRASRNIIDGTGRVLSSAPFPGEGAMLAAEIPLPEHGRMPPDRWLARLSVAVVAALIGWLGVKPSGRRCVVKPVPVLNLSDNSPSMNYLGNLLSPALSSTRVWRRGRESARGEGCVRTAAGRGLPALPLPGCLEATACHEKHPSIHPAVLVWLSRL